VHSSRFPKKPSRRSAAVITATLIGAAGLLAASGTFASASASASPGTFIGGLHHTKVVASTVPGNGDINPYGVAVVPHSTGDLRGGDVLVSNFNDKANAQGTGTTIVQVSPRGKAALFAQISDPACPGGVGLTTALVALPSGWVIVGSLPTVNGAISGAGCLIVLDQWGNVRKTITGYGINGPWDMTAVQYGDTAELFVTNVLGGILTKHPYATGGTVQRLLITSTPYRTPRVLASTTIGSGFPAKTDPNALVIGPTGVGLGDDGTLYVADSVNNRIAGIPNAAFRHHSDGPGFTVSASSVLNDPLGLVIAPNGDILTVNGGNGDMLEFTPGGDLAAKVTVDNNAGGGGNLFGLAVKPGHDAVYFVDDFGTANDLRVLF
jgi:NHL repeat